MRNGHKPAQRQKRQPGVEREMRPKPKSKDLRYRGSGKLKGKVALVTGGDSGIGQSVAIYFAKEGAKVSIVYLSEHDDAQDCKKLVEKEGSKCLLISGDIGNEQFCQQAVAQTVEKFGRLDILVNNAAEQHEEDDLEKVTASDLERTFRTNVFSCFYMAKASLKHFKEGASIINTSSVTAYRGSDHLLSYASTKGAIISFTRSLSSALVDAGIRVNAVAPGPIWTPFIPSTFKAKDVANFGKKVPMGRPGQPSEVAPCYVFLASNDSSYMTGQVLHPNGGEVVNA